MNEGDSGGPYHLSQCGKKLKMGERGIGTFISATDDGKGVMIKFGRLGPSRFVYIGPEYVSQITGIVMRPHKVVKLRRK